MAPILFDLPPFLLTTLGIFELSVVYCPVRDHFYLTPLGNNQEDMVAAKFNARVPVQEIQKFPREVFVHKDVLDCIGSGEPVDIITPSRIYFAINETSERLYAVEDQADASRIHVVADGGDSYLIGYNYCYGEMRTDLDDCVMLFKGVIPFVTRNNATSLDFKNSYITIEDVESTDEYKVVSLLGRDFVGIECKEPN